MTTTNEPKYYIIKQFEDITAFKNPFKVDAILKGIINGEVIIRDYFKEQNDTLVFYCSGNVEEDNRNITGVHFWGPKYYYYIEHVDIGAFIDNLLEKYKTLIREKINDLKELI